jgi:hypothetical protein
MQPRFQLATQLSFFLVLDFEQRASCFFEPLYQLHLNGEYLKYS